MYPRLFLTSHFWSIQQKSDFQQIYLKKRLSYNIKVFRCLQSQLGFIYQQKCYEKWKDILGLLGSGRHPTADEILDVIEIFTVKPYHLNYLPAKHIVSFSISKIQVLEKLYFNSILESIMSHAWNS